jgi:hypothetical protein
VADTNPNHRYILFFLHFQTNKWTIKRFGKAIPSGVTYPIVQRKTGIKFLNPAFSTSPISMVKWECSIGRQIIHGIIFYFWPTILFILVPSSYTSDDGEKIVINRSSHQSISQSKVDSGFPVNNSSLRNEKNVALFSGVFASFQIF